jgi:hypothetical protein
VAQTFSNSHYGFSSADFRRLTQILSAFSACTVRRHACENLRHLRMKGFTMRIAGKLFEHPRERQ